MKNLPHTRHRRQGFTLAEMMVVIVIIGLLVTLVVPNVLQKLSAGNKMKAKADITAISSALTEYAMQNGGKFPESLEALVTPDQSGYTYLRGLKSIPKDPWDTEYQYEPPGPGQPEPRVLSLGRDKQLGGEGDDADIDSALIMSGEQK